MKKLSHGHLFIQTIDLLNVLSSKWFIIRYIQSKLHGNISYFVSDLSIQLIGEIFYAKVPDIKIKWDMGHLVEITKDRSFRGNTNAIGLCGVYDGDAKSKCSL